MATFTQYVRYDGGGDYTDLFAGISGILASGVAASGDYSDYYLLVDNSEYSGSFNADVPYTGHLYVITSGAYIYLNDECRISGIKEVGESTFSLQNCYIISSNAGYVFNNISGCHLELSNTRMLNISNGIINSGTLTIDNVSAYGTGSGYFIRDYGSTNITDSHISHFVTGIDSTDLSVSNTRFSHNNTSIDTLSGTMLISDSLFYQGSGINTIDSTVYIQDSTFDGYPIYTSGGYLEISGIISQADETHCIEGINTSGKINSSCLYPSGQVVALTSVGAAPGDGFLSGCGNIHEDPLFKSKYEYDYRLKLQRTTGSPCIEYTDKNEVVSGVIISNDNAQFVISDSHGNVPLQQFLRYVYQQGSTTLFDSYGRETEFADRASEYDELWFTQYIKASFTASNVIVEPSFTRDETPDPYPYDWDYKTIDTTEITDENGYIIPRSIINMETVLRDYIGNLTDSTLYSQITKDAITVKYHPDYRGISYDFQLALPGQAPVWLIDGTNQRLLKKNAYTSEVLEDYPLFTPNLTGKLIVRPSGLIPVNWENNKYQYIIQHSPNTRIYTDNEDGVFNWIPTHMDMQKDIRGILSYKDNLFLTASEYSQSIYNRDSIPTYSGVGKVYLYSNNETFKHYIANYTTSDGPSVLTLSSGNVCPTDITVYEDGTFYIADYNYTTKLFGYTLKYDYALMRSSYDDETLFILRENYDSVGL